MGIGRRRTNGFSVSGLRSGGRFRKNSKKASSLRSRAGWGTYPGRHHRFAAVSRFMRSIMTAVWKMAQAVYLKYFVCHDFVTSTGGIAVGWVAAFVVLIMARSTLSPRGSET